MNRIFSIIWSRTRRTWVVASELACRGGKGGTTVDKRTAVLKLAPRCGAAANAPPQISLRPLRLGILLALLAPCAPAKAVNYYWDTDGATAGAGGAAPSGTWSASGTTLSTDVNGAAATGAITTTTADRLFLSAGTDATGNYTVTVNGTQNIGRVTFEEGTVNLTGGTINFGAVNGIIEGAAPADANSISSVIAGTGGLRFSNGTFTLNGAAANTYTGTTRVGGSGLGQASLILSSAGGNAISGSMLQLGGGNYTSAGFVTLGAADQINDTATVALTSGHYSGSSIFSLNGFNETIGGIDLHRQGNASSVTFRNGAAMDATVTLAGSGTYTTISGDRVGGRNIIDGAAGRLNIVVALTGSGMQTFGGTDARYTGTTTINSGTLRLWNTSLWASNATLNGGTLQLHQTSASVPSLVAGAATRTHANTIGGTGGTLRKTGDGTVILSGNNTYQGATAIDEGTLRAGSASAFGNNSAVTLVNTAGATMDLNGFNISIGSLAGGGTTGGNVTLGGATLTTGGNNTSTIYGGVISGSGALIKTGTGTQTLTGANTYSGNTTVSAGTLQLGNGGAAGSLSSAQATVAAGATLAVNRSNAFTLNQAVTGDGTLVQRGTGTTTMSANSDIDHVVLEHGRLATPGTLFTDDISFTDDGGAALQVTGTLQTAAAGAALVTGGLLNDTVRIDVSGDMLANGTLGDGADTLDVAGALDTGGGSFDLGDGDDSFVIHDNTDIIGTVDGGAGNDTLNANIAASATLGAAQTFETLTKTGAGTLSITGPGNSDFSTVNVNAGTVAIDVGAALDAPTGGTLATTIAGGATLNVDGDYGCGSGDDTLTVAGTISGGGSIDQCGGDDTLTLNDGATLANTMAVSGGTHTAGDIVVLNNALALTVDGADIANYEFLTKQNAGAATLTGSHGYSGGATIAGGMLDVNGTLETPAIDLADGTELNVDGTVQAVGATQTTITGSGGANTVSVGTGGTLLADGDLDAGADTLDVSGTLDTGGGSFLLGDSDDNFIVHDGTVILGTVDGGAGIDTRTYNINTSANLGALVNFESVTKTGAGVLNITGPGATDLMEVEVLAGTLDVFAGASVVATGGSSLNTLISGGAILNVDGDYGCGADNDAMTVSGAISGGGTIDQCGGDDVLTLDDGATLVNNMAISGGAHATGDTVVLNNALALTFDGADIINYEFLTKQNTGVAVLAGSHNYNGGTTIVGGTLDVNGTLETPTIDLANGTELNVDGTAQAAGTTQAMITGSAGVNTVNVGTGGTLFATGDLGDGADVLDVAGTLDTGAGTFALGIGDDIFIVHDGTNVIGTVEGGADTDIFNTDVAASADLGAATGFETLTKTGAGVLNLNGPAASSFDAVNIDAGTLNIVAAGSLEGVQDATVAGGASLVVDGSMLFTPGADNFTVNGSVSGLGTLNMLGGDDTLTLNTGADLTDLAKAIDGGADTDTIDVNGLSFEVGGGGLRLDNWENLNLLNGSRLNQRGDLVLDNSGILYIDAGSVWSPGNHMLSGNVDNAGRIEVGGNAATIDGDYRSFGDAGIVAIEVSPANGTSGMLQITGDVQGFSTVEFTGDGSQPFTTNDILVIASPNDLAGTAGGFRPEGQGTGNIVRLDGTLLPFLFSQQSDNNWYLTPTGIENLPEIPGYSGGGTLGVMTAGYMQKTAEDRSNQLRECFIHEQSLSRSEAAGYCSRAWVLLPRNRIDIEGNPGFAMDGDLNSLYLGTDNLEMTGDNSAFMVGAYLLYQQGEFDAANPAGQPAALDTTTRAGGLYGGLFWPGGTYLDINASLSAMESRVQTQDGFDQSLHGTMLNLAARIGHPFQVSPRWRLDPHFGLSAASQQWNDIVDAAGRDVDLEPDTWTAAQAGARLTRQSGGWRFWLSLLAAKTLDGGETQLTLSTGNNSQTFEGHRFDSNGKAAIGISGVLTERIEISGETSATRSIDGTEYEESEIYLGMRIIW